MYHKNNFKIFFRLITIAYVLLTFQACNKEDNDNPVAPVTHVRGEIVQTNSLGNMTVNEIQQLLAGANVTIPFTLTYSVETISIRYYTTDKSGNNVIVSGALLVPQGTNNLPLVSIQHGTQTKRDLVASVSPANSTEGMVGLIMASIGYMVVVPDYLGFGVSNVMHPYIHAKSLIPCIIDLMRASKTYSSENQITLDGRVFLTGYSEGGYASLVTQKEIEENYTSEFNLTAVAPLSGPYDLQGMTETIFQSGSYSTPAYIAFFLTAYNDIYRWSRLDDFFNAPYASMMPGLFDGTKTWGEIVNQLPATFSALMNSTFVSDYVNGNEQNLHAAAQENTFLNWVPQTPVHFFHGDADEVVPLQNALTAVDRFTSNGATNIHLTTIPGGTHETSGPYAIVGAIQWFESIYMNRIGMR